MTKDFYGEQWKTLKFDFDHVNKIKIEISNFGRIRSTNKFKSGNIINGSLVNGYPIIRLKFFKPREEKSQKEFDSLRKRIAKLTTQIKVSKENRESKSSIAAFTAQLNQFKDTLAEKMRVDEKLRRMYYQKLTHRLVAALFLRKPTAGQVVVAHLDFNKLNNKAHNLRWMTLEENVQHQKKSPYVIADKEDRRYKRKSSHTTKLTVTKVMLLKKLLNQNKPIRQLVKQFKVTDTQIIRIRKGINWGEIEAAK